MKSILKDSKLIDLENKRNKIKNFNKIGIAKLYNFHFDHDHLKNYYDSVSKRIEETAVSKDLLEYSSNWKEIALIKDWQITNDGLLMKDSLNKVRTQFNSGIRYMSFYSAKPGLVLHKHRDLTGNLIQGFLRLHIPIYTHPECFYICGNFLNKIKIHAKSGNVYALDTGYLHGVMNLSSINRIHLLIELEVNEWLKSFLPKKNYDFFLHFFAFYFIWAPISVLKNPTLLKRLIKAKFKNFRLL